MLKELVKRSRPLPSGSKLLIMGGGFSGQHFAALMRSLGNEVLCTRRDNQKPGADLIFNSSTNQILPETAFEGVTHVLSCIPPSPKGEDPVLIHLQNQLKQLKLKWVGYLSTTGVYGDSGGSWVKESDTPKPQQERSKRRLSCEIAWQLSGLPVQIIRLPGIYGPGRSALESIKSGKCKLIDKPGQVFSRIHVDDIAGATLHIIHQASKGWSPQIINVADDKPISNKDVLLYAAKLLAISNPPLQPFKIAAKTMSPMALSFWEENRRVSNELLCQTLGYKLMHPDFKVGLEDCLLQDNFNQN